MANKRISELRQKVDKSRSYAVEEAVELAKELANEKFGSRVDVVVKIGVDPRKHMVRGVSQLPAGTGKQVKVLVFADGQAAEDAKEAGAEYVGMEELVSDIQSGDLSADAFDVCIALPSAMKSLGKIAKILGPKGKMPNAKLGTVTPNVADAVINVKKGQVKFAVEKGSLVHCSVGAVAFATNDLVENIKQFIVDLKKAKPSAAKGQYMQKMSLSTTMGPGIPVDLSSIS